MFKWISVGLVLVFLLSLPFLIKVKIECQSQFGACPEELLTKLSSINNKNLISAKASIGKILKGDPLVSDFSTQFKLPNTLLASLIVKKPVAAILDKTTNKYYLVDANGKVLSIVGSTALPFVIQDNPNPNLFALKLVEGVYQMYQVGSGEIENDTLVVELPTSVKVIFPLEGDSDLLLGSLRLIYSRMDTAKYREIDLRFKNPVLR